MRIVKTKSSVDNLCNYCNLDFATCPKATHIEFGNGTGNDNVIECSEFLVERQVNGYPMEKSEFAIEYADIDKSKDPTKCGEKLHEGEPNGN